MEPFFLRCETCQARLRVRDERFLGQIQACPKCGSMVQIVAPAGWLAQGEATAEAPPELTEFAASTSPSATANAIAWVRGHAIASAAGATGLLAACGLAAFLALSGNEQEISQLPASSVIAETAEEPTKPVEVTAVEMNDAAANSNELPPSETTAEEIAQIAEADSKPAPEPPSETVAASEATSTSFLPLVTPPKTEVASNEPSSQPRTLTLEPVAQDPKPAAATEESPHVAAYPPEVETAAASEASDSVADDGDVAKAAPAAEEVALPSLDPPAQRTNIKDQLSMPIESINMPAMPIGDFVSFVSTLTAVPIELDAKVLGEVGLSSHSTVDVQGKSTTAGKLLARVLKERQLTCIERDGTLVVVRAKR